MVYHRLQSSFVLIRTHNISFLPFELISNITLTFYCRDDTQTRFPRGGVGCVGDIADKSNEDNLFFFVFYRKPRTLNCNITACY